MIQPLVYMIAGPNGAGKTTAALKLLPDFLSVYEFVNADEIARGLNPLKPDEQDMAAGRLMVERIDDLMRAKKNFAFETTGASQMFVQKLKQAKSDGYRLGLLYLWLPNIAFAKGRVKIRVMQGGHDIPEADIERRYKRSLHNLIHLYLPLADQASIFDNSNVSEPQLIAEKQGAKWRAHNQAAWSEIEKAAEGGMDG